MQIRKYLNQTYEWRSAHWLACRTRQTFNERRMIEWLHEWGTLFRVKFCCVGNDGTKRYSARAEKQRKIKWFRVIRIGRSHCHVKLSIRIIYSSQVCTLCECSCCGCEWVGAVGCVFNCHFLQLSNCIRNCNRDISKSYSNVLSMTIVWHDARARADKHTNARCMHSANWSWELLLIYSDWKASAIENVYDNDI